MISPLNPESQATKASPALTAPKPCISCNKTGNEAGG